MEHLLRIVLEGGKYIYEQDDKGSRALRYGEPWRDLTGDNLVYSMACEIELQRVRITALRKMVRAALEK